MIVVNYCLISKFYFFLFFLCALFSAQVLDFLINAASYFSIYIYRYLILTIC